MRFVTLSSLLAVAAITAQAATQGSFLQNLTDVEGPNPTGVQFNLYEPPSVPEGAPLVVVAHSCGTTAEQWFGWSPFPAIADYFGFPVLFPNSPHSDHCWDVGSNGTLQHDGGGDSLGIVTFVRHAIKKYNSDTGRIFVTGHSSGGMMTQVLVGAYPDVFAAGAASAGVPFGCWADPQGRVAMWNADCAQGKISKTGSAWAKLVRNAFPGYKGYRPKLQLFHGTADEAINYNNFKESVKEWTAVFKVRERPNKIVNNYPTTNWTETIYGHGELEAFSDAGGFHQLSYRSDLITNWFDVRCSAMDPKCFRRPDKPLPKTLKPFVPTSPPPPAALGAQCGGSAWTGAMTCAEGKCVEINEWYSQCQ